MLPVCIGDEWLATPFWASNAEIVATPENAPTAMDGYSLDAPFVKVWLEPTLGFKQ